MNGRDPSGADSGLIDSRSGFHAALRAALRAAAEQGCREIWCVDRHFADWPLGERDVVDLLSRWVSGRRRLVLLAQNFDELPRRHARWVQWRVQWAHVVTCKQVHDDDTADMPCLLLATDLVSVRLHSTEHYRGRIDRDPAEWVRQRELISMLDQRGSDAFPATVLGL
ncbi:MAG TPA: hypothetical protein VFL86_11575 [Burkholderiaceae bacterium]|nr:hypothetical protein [Burkholderiaceae bacterium]